MSWKIHVHPNCKQILKDYKAPKDKLFGENFAPIMFKAEFDNEAWGDLEMLPYGPISLDPSCKVLHYGQEIFEGAKAYMADEQGPYTFRLEENWKRFNHSAQRMAMPQLPQDLFMSAVEGMVEYCHFLIPRGSGESLYLRPFMFATERNVGIKPSSKFLFMVIACPVGNYFTKPNVKLLIERKYARATPGGTGTAKTGGNYAAGLLSKIEAEQRDCDQTLWLDSKENRYLEELSGMNIFCVINNVLCTPVLTDTILEGITRKSILELARSMNLETKEMKIDIDEILAAIQNGQCTEMFACGTAVIITPVASLHEFNGKRYDLKFPNGNIAMELRESLINLQEGKSEDPFNWRKKITPKEI